MILKIKSENQDDLVIHVETNDLINNVKSANIVKKMLRQATKHAPSIDLAFYSAIVWKHKKKLHKSLSETNARLGVFYLRKSIAFVDNKNIN